MDCEHRFRSHESALTLISVLGASSLVLSTAIRLDRRRQTADIRDFEGAGASGSGALAWARRRNTCLALVGRRIANTVGPQRTRRSKTCLRTRVNSSALFRNAARPCWIWTYQGRVSADVSELSFDSRTSIVQSSRSLQNEIMYLEVEGNDVLMRESWTMEMETVAPSIRIYTNLPSVHMQDGVGRRGGGTRDETRQKRTIPPQRAFLLRDTGHRPVLSKAEG
jgi:hypothetical protein